MCDSSVDLNNVDWNNFEITAFQELHRNFSVDKQPRKKRSENNHQSVIKIGNKKYEIPTKELVRYKALKNEKAKSNFRENILETCSPISEL